MSNNLKTLKTQRDLILIPLQKRFAYYRDNLESIRKVLADYFLDPYRLSSLHEIPKQDEQIFNCTEKKDHIATCFMSLDQLTEKAYHIGIKLGDNKTSLVRALDNVVQKSNLTIQWQNNEYQFKQADKPFTSKAQLFMQQLGQGLTLYRMFIQLFECYYSLLQYPFLKSSLYEEFLEQAIMQKKPYKTIRLKMT